MDYMTHVIDRLEAWRIANGLNKTEMAKLIGANSSQQYTNWVGRNSLPKEFFRRAADILGDNASEVAPAGPVEVPTLPYKGSVFSHLTDEQKMKAALSLIDSMSDKERAAILAKIVSGE